MDAGVSQESGEFLDKLVAYNSESVSTAKVSSTEDFSESISPLECQCKNDGHNTCSCFKNHQKIVTSLEKDLNLAAEIGQALLHERQSMQHLIETLKENVDDVNRQNSELLADNDVLLQELNNLNEQYSISEDQLQALSASLDEAKGRIIWLSNQVMQSKALEAQVHSLELIRDSLQHDLDSTSRHKQEAELRWRSSEKMLERLSLQYEQLELESYNAVVMNHNEPDTTSETSKDTMHGFVESLIAENARMSASIAELEAKVATMAKESHTHSYNSPAHTPTKDLTSIERDIKTAVDDSIGLVTPPKSQEKSQGGWQHQNQLLSPDDTQESLSPNVTQEDEYSYRGRKGHARYPSFNTEPLSPISPAPAHLGNRQFLSEILPAALKRSNSHDSIMSRKLPPMDFLAPPSALRSKQLLAGSTPFVSLTSTDTLSRVDAYASKNSITTGETSLYDEMDSRALLANMASLSGRSSSLKGKLSVAESLTETISSHHSDRSTAVNTSTSSAESKSWASAFFQRISKMTSTGANVSESPLGEDSDEYNDIHVVPGLGFPV